MTLIFSIFKQMAQPHDNRIAEDLIEKIKKMMQFSSSWPLENTWKQTFTRYLYLIIFVATFLPMIIQVFMDSNIYKISYGLCCLVTAFNCFIKYAALLSNKSQFAKILEHLKDPLFVLHEGHKLLKNRIRICELIRRGLYCGIVTSIFMVINPIPHMHSYCTNALSFENEKPTECYLCFCLVYSVYCCRKRCFVWGSI